MERSDERFFEHLTVTDRAVLERVAGEVGADGARLRDDPAALAALLAHPGTFATLFGSPAGEALVPASPFLVFAVVVHRGWAELGERSHVREWVGVRQRLPVLSAHELRAFLDDPARRLFLTELLASYTRVASGSTWVRTRRGWRRRRWSELDPLRLAELLEVLPETEHAGVYRRLGDLALFLTGVFPDHIELAGVAEREARRLRTLTGVGSVTGGPGLPGSDGAVALLEQLGAGWYLAARRRSLLPRSPGAVLLTEVAERFAVARRTLNHLTDRYLFGHRARWFTHPAG